jgi:hypothetical protein
VRLPVTKRGICLGTHTSVLREQGVSKTPTIWFLAPSTRDTDPIWKACSWSRCVPADRAIQPLVFKVDLGICTPFDKV